MPRSLRLQKQEEEDRKLRVRELEQNRQNQRRQPRQCTTCPRQARRGCQTCRVCHTESQAKDKDALFINQGCPFLNSGPGLHPIQWNMEFPRMSAWITDNLHCQVNKGSKLSRSKQVQVLGWRDSNDLDEERSIPGTFMSNGS
jgi:hypothetical protein